MCSTEVPTAPSAVSVSLNGTQPVGCPRPLLAHSWRSIRLFISSTFRDMHGERDLLLRTVLPALQARAASHRISLHGIDLHWGVTEEDTWRNRYGRGCGSGRRIAEMEPR